MRPELGPVLVVGGCRFLGHLIVSRLCESTALEIWVLDLNTEHNRLHNVSYCDGDITSYSHVQAALQKIKPRTIIHTASPNVLTEHPNFATRKARYEKVNILGTQNLLDCAGKSGSVKAFVYTSSASVVHDSINDLFEADESLPGLQTPQQTEIYSQTKGVVENIVLAANRKYGSMLTTAIRPTSMFGEDDAAWIPSLLNIYRTGKINNQMGNDSAKIDLLYVDNAADAHILAVETLDKMHEETPHRERVDDEAFFVTNDEHYRFWDFARAVWHAAGDRSDPERVWVIPKNIGLMMATFVEWVFWLVFWGSREPKSTRRKIKHTCMNRTFRIDKAKSRLGYVPEVSMKEGIERGVKLFLEVEAQDLTKKIFDRVRYMGIGHKNDDVRWLP